MAGESKRVEVRAERDRSSRPRSQYVEYEDEWLEPTDDEVDEWAARERRRREAWLSGPTEQEKLDWAQTRRQQAGESEPGLAVSGPTDDEIEEWAARERRRRE